MLRFFYLFSTVIFIIEVTKTNARIIDSKKIQHNVTLPTSAQRQSKAAEMCNKYIASICKTPVPTSIPTSNSTEIIDGTNGIVRGRPASPKEYPHMAWIYGDLNRLRAYCGGTLISENFVLTAAHCMVPERDAPKINTIRLGELNLANIRDDARVVEYSITDVFVHPNYDSVTAKHDIALLKFKGLTSFSDYIRPICLNTLDNIPDQTFTAVGWGKTSTNGKASNDLLSVELNPLNINKCYSTYAGYNHTAQLCVGYRPGRKGVCDGDSGGPLQIVNKTSGCSTVPIYAQIGITSFGHPAGCALADTASVFTKVSHYIPWIESIVWK